MNTKECLQRFEETAEIYLRDLDAVSMEQLVLKPDEFQWSLGQMYMHLIQSSLHMQLRNIEACRASASISESVGVKTEMGYAIYKSGSFPPMAIQVPPSKEYTPPQPDKKEQIKEGLHLVIQKMREVEPLLNEISPSQTRPHPSLGALNAQEWFRLIEMHFRHHLLQKSRLVNLS